MENIRNFNESSVDDMMPNVDNKRCHEGVIWVICLLLIAGVVFSQKFAYKPLAGHTATSENELLISGRPLTSALDFTQILKEQKNRQAFEIKAQVSY